MKKLLHLLILTLLLLLTACEQRASSAESKKVESNIKKMECTYSIKPNKKYPYGDMVTFPDCGEIKNGKLLLKKEYLDNMSLKKGLESDYGLTTVYGKAGLVYYVSKEGKTERMYFFDMGADYFQEGLARYIDSNEKMGFLNPKLEIVITANYDYATFFQDGYAIVSNGSHSEKISDSKYEEHTHAVGGKWGAIDKKGELVIPLKYDSEGEVKKMIKDLKKLDTLLYKWRT
jgi:hypothetical protein